MSRALCCFKNWFDRIPYTENHGVQRELNPISLDTGYMGHEVVVIKNGTRVCGSGGVLASAPIVQNKSYFEVKVQQSGVWSCGLATRLTNLNATSGGDSESWALTSSRQIVHNFENVVRIGVDVQEGDIIGIWYDHIELNFSVNGKPLDCPVRGVKGTVYPALWVDDGSILDILLDDFNTPPPPGYDKILREQTIL